LQVRPVDGFLRLISSKDVKSRKDAPFGATELKFDIKSLFILKNRQNLAQNGTVFFRL